MHHSQQHSFIVRACLTFGRIHNTWKEQYRLATNWQQSKLQLPKFKGGKSVFFQMVSARKKLKNQCFHVLFLKIRKSFREIKCTSSVDKLRPQQWRPPVILKLIHFPLYHTSPNLMIFYTLSRNCRRDCCLLLSSSLLC